MRYYDVWMLHVRCVVGWLLSDLVVHGIAEHVGAHGTEEQNERL